MFSITGRGNWKGARTQRAEPETQGGKWTIQAGKTLTKDTVYTEIHLKRQNNEIIKHSPCFSGFDFNRSYNWPSWQVQRRSCPLWTSHPIHLLNTFPLRWCSMLCAHFLYFFSSIWKQFSDLLSCHVFHLKPKPKSYSTARARLQEPIDLDELISPSESEKEEDEWRPEKNEKARRGSKKSKMTGVRFQFKIWIAYIFQRLYRQLFVYRLVPHKQFKTGMHVMNTRYLTCLWHGNIIVRFLLQPELGLFCFDALGSWVWVHSDKQLSF